MTIEALLYVETARYTQWSSDQGHVESGTNVRSGS